MRAVIQAGGKGTRLANVTQNIIPKPLAPINGIPMLEIQMMKLKQQGIRNFVFIIGHLGGKIREYFNEGEKWKVYIEYIEENEPLGSAGALYYLKEMIYDDCFLFIYGDIIFDVDISRMISFHENNKSEATLLVHPNSHPYDSDLVQLDANSRILAFDSKKNVREYWYDNCTNAGFFLLSKSIIEGLDRPIKRDLENDIIRTMIKENKKVYGYRTSEYVKDAGTKDRFLTVEKDLASGYTVVKNLQNRQKCIFIDRDGTVNKLKGHLWNEKELELEEGVIDAVKLINASEYLAIIVTNQPVVARGLCEIEDIETIHHKLSSLLGNEGAFLDDIIFCPHHPDGGYPNERLKYKIKCSCRKPKTGMIDKMVEKYNIDVSKSYMIGDTTRDIMTGVNANLHTILVKTGEAGEDGKYKVKAEHEAKNLKEAVEIILKGDLCDI